MRKITDKELQESDCEIYIPHGAELPREVISLLSGYIDTPLKGFYMYRVPKYLARQINAAMEHHLREQK